MLLFICHTKEMATDLSMVFADGDAAKETAATPSGDMALAETEDMEDEDLLEDEDDEAQRIYKLQLPVVSVSIVIWVYVGKPISCIPLYTIY